MAQYLKAQSFFFVEKLSRREVSSYPVFIITLTSLVLIIITTYLIWVLFNNGFYYSLYLLIPLYIFAHFFVVGVKSLLKGWY
ncbi:MAG: hypothetical protein ACK416_00160 [Zestosphaera sp.]